MQDHLGRPLQLQVSPSTRDDTLLACMCFRIYESDACTQIAKMREKLLLHFVALIFDQTFDSVDDFLRAWRQLIPAPKYRHPAVQIWVYQLHRANPKGMPSNIRMMDANDIVSQAVHFVRVNNKPGKCSCRFTMSYIFASVFNMDVYLIDAHRGNRTNVISCFHQNQTSEIDITSVFSKSPVANARGKEEFFVYIVYDGAKFALWLPERVVRAADLAWLTRDASTERVKAGESPFRLVCCKDATVEPVSYFAHVGAANRLVYWAIVDATKHGAGIYRVIPANVQQLALVPPLFIYTSRGQSRDDSFSLVGYLDREGAPAAFLLDPVATRLVIAVQHDDGSFAEQCIAEGLKLTLPR